MVDAEETVDRCKDVLRAVGLGRWESGLAVGVADDLAHLQPAAREQNGHGRRPVIAPWGFKSDGPSSSLVTSFLPAELADVIHTLKEHGYKVVVLYVGTEELPQLPEGVIVHELAEYFERLEYTSEFSPR